MTPKSWEMRIRAVLSDTVNPLISRSNQGRFTGNRHGNHHTMTHPPAQLMRIFPDPPGRVRDANPLKEGFGLFKGQGPLEALMGPKDLRNLVPDSKYGI